MYKKNAATEPSYEVWGPRNAQNFQHLRIYLHCAAKFLNSGWLSLLAALHHSNVQGPYNSNSGIMSQVALNDSFTPVACTSSCQCRSRIAGFCNSVTARSDVIRFLTVFSVPWYVSQARISLSRVLRSFPNFLQSMSIWSTLISLHGVVFQSLIVVCMMLVWSHSVLIMISSFRQTFSCLNSGIVTSNRPPASWISVISCSMAANASFDCQHHRRNNSMKRNLRMTLMNLRILDDYGIIKKNAEKSKHATNIATSECSQLSIKKLQCNIFIVQRRLAIATSLTTFVEA